MSVCYTKYMQFFKRFSLILFCSFVLLSTHVSFVYAACDPSTETSTDIGCLPNTAEGFVAKFYAYGLGLIGGVAIIFIILGGYFILVSQGDPAKLALGKSYITYAVIGLLLAIFGYIFTSVIAVDILRIPGFN